MIYPESPLTGYEYFELVCGCIFVILFLRILVWIKKNTLNFSFNNFPFSIIKLTIYLFLISGIIGVLSTMYHGINLLWENFSNELLISYTALIFSYLIIVIECFRIIDVLKKIMKKCFQTCFYKKLAYYKEHRKRFESEHFPYDIIVPEQLYKR